MTEKKRPTVEELKAMVGKKEYVDVVEIEKGFVRRFAEAVGDPNPLWRDEEYARQTKYGGLIAPPYITIIALISGGHIYRDKLEVEMPYERGVAGDGEWEFLRPIRVGDVLITSHKLADVYERVRKDGSKMAFLVYEETHRNQKGELVAISRSSIISFP